MNNQSDIDVSQRYTLGIYYMKVTPHESARQQ
jgi:hypothetical protein